MTNSSATRVPVLQDVDPGALAANRNASAYGFPPGPGVDFPLPRVARLPQPAVPGYHALDAWIAWQAPHGAEPALTGRNLSHARHPASGAAGLRRQAERALFAGAAPRFRSP
jgi:iron complex outermembrane receptor protein